MPVQVSSLKRNYVKLYLQTEKYIPSKYCCFLLDPFESLNKSSFKVTHRYQHTGGHTSHC